MMCNTASFARPAHRFTSALGLNYLMLVLAPGTTQQQLKDMKPDTTAMMLAVDKSIVSGVIVTLHEGELSQGHPCFSGKKILACWLTFLAHILIKRSHLGCVARSFFENEHNFLV